MDAEEQPFRLCEDVLVEIFKHLDLKDLKNLSLTSKCSYDVTKEYFEKQTKLLFSRALSLKELSAFSNSKRNYQEINVSVYDYDDTILQQLTYLKMKVSLVHLNIILESKLKNISERASYLKTKYKIPKVLICYEYNVNSFEDIDKLQSANICTNDITSIKLNIDDIPDDFDLNNEIFKKVTEEFPSLDSFAFDIDCQSYLEKIDPNIRLNIGRLHIFSDINNENLLEVFQGLHTLIIEDYYDPDFLQALIELNKHTLKTLHLKSFCSNDSEFVVPCQLKTLNITACEMDDPEHLLTNQNKLECLILSVPFTPEFMEMLAIHCPPTLHIKSCDYNLEYTPNQIRQFTPQLPIVKHLTINQIYMMDILPKTKNVETLKIVIHVSGEYREFHPLNGLELKHLKTMEIKRSHYENFAKNVIKDFSEITMNLPKLERIKCIHFNMVLFQKYSHIKFLECGLCNLENIVVILKVLTKLEEFKCFIKAKDLIKVINYFETVDLGEHLKNVIITTQHLKSINMGDILRKLKLKGDKMFCTYDRKKEKHCSVNFTVEMDIKNKQFMYKLIKKY